jgi:hypothetical protein
MLDREKRKKPRVQILGFAARSVVSWNEDV